MPPHSQKTYLTRSQAVGYSGTSKSNVNRLQVDDGHGRAADVLLYSVRWRRRPFGDNRLVSFAEKYYPERPLTD